MAIIILKGSVGTGKAKGGRPHNDPDDVRAIRDRFVELGYTWVGTIKGGSDKEFIRTIRLFQCACMGRHRLDRGDGRIDPARNTHRWLVAENAPGWTSIFGESGIGWRCTNDFVQSNGGFATTWLLNGLFRAGIAYTGKLLSDGIGRTIEAPPMWVRECSPQVGGNASGHGSHETGLDVDLRLPLLPPDSLKWTKLPRGYRDKRFDKATSQLQLEAIKEQMNTRVCFFNYRKFINKGLCKPENATHDNHYHVRIKPPDRIEGIATVYELGSKVVKEAHERMSNLTTRVFESIDDLYDRVTNR